MMSFGQMPVCCGIVPTTIILPFLQHGHRVISIPVSVCIISSTDFDAGFPLCEGTPNSRRTFSIFSALSRLARNPKCLILTNPFGRVWSKNRRMNSTAEMVLCLI